MNRFRILLLSFFIFSTFSLAANPFLSSPDKEKLPDKPRQGGFPVPSFLIEGQREFREKVAEFFYEFEENPTPSVLFAILGFSFLYGVIHAAGPGHRKSILFTLFLSRKSRWWEPAAAGGLSAALHAGSGIFIISILYLISRRFLSNRVNKVSIYLEGITYLFIALLALVFIILKIREISRNHHSHGLPVKSAGLYLTVIISSLFPCPGAVMILMFSLALDQYLLGIFSVLFLSLGMGLTISAASYLAYGGRERLFRLLKKREDLMEKTGRILEVGAFSFLFLFSLWMVLPFVVSLM